MNETKKISLEEAKSEIKRISQEARECREFTRPEAFDQVLDILKNVEMPSEDEMAVIWLMKKKSIYIHWVELHHVCGWFADTHLEYTRWREVVPSEEARKLGWVDEFEEEDPIESLYHGNQIKLDDLVAHWESLGLSEFSHSLEMRNGATAMKRRMLEELRQFVKVEAQNRSNKEEEIEE